MSNDWVCSPECYHLCFLIRSIQQQGKSLDLVDAMRSHVALFLKPRCAVIVVEDDLAMIRCVQASTGDELCAIQLEEHARAIALSPDRAELTVGFGRTLQLIEVLSGQVLFLRDFGMHLWHDVDPVDNEIRSMAYSFDARHLVVGSEYGSVSIVQMPGMEVLSKIQCGENPILFAEFTHSGENCVVWEYEHIYVIEVSSSSILHKQLLRCRVGCGRLAYVPKHNLVVTARDGHLDVYAFTQLQSFAANNEFEDMSLHFPGFIAQHFPGLIATKSIVCSPDGENLAVGAGAETGLAGYIYLMNFRRFIGFCGFMHALRDVHWPLFCAGDPDLVAEAEASIQYMQALIHPVLWVAKVHDDIDRVAYTSCGKMLAISCDHGLFYIASASTGSVLHELHFSAHMHYLEICMGYGDSILQSRHETSVALLSHDVIQRVVHDEPPAQVDEEIAALAHELDWADTVGVRLQHGDTPADTDVVISGAHEIDVNESMDGDDNEVRAADHRISEKIYLLRFRSAPRGDGGSSMSFFKSLCEGSHLKPCLSAMANAGQTHELHGGALIFVQPVHYDAARQLLDDVELHPFHIVIGQSFMYLVDEALQCIPYNRRPKVKDTRMLGEVQASPCLYALREKNTFLEYVKVQGEAHTVVQSSTEVVVNLSSWHYQYFRGHNPRHTS